jgi:hypothetical protein
MVALHLAGSPTMFRGLSAHRAHFASAATVMKALLSVIREGGLQLFLAKRRFLYLAWTPCGLIYFFRRSRRLYNWSIG